MSAMFRAIARRPGYPAAAALTLTLAVGASTAVFAVVRAALLQPLPFAEAERVTAVWLRSATGERLPVPAPVVDELAAGSDAFDAWGYVLRTAEAALGHAGDPVPVSTNLVSANLFELLSVRPAAGRLFTEAEAFAAGDDGATLRPVLLDYGFWMRGLGGDRNVIGSTLRIDGQPVIVLGVLPSGFRLVLAAEAGIAPVADVWLPIREPLATLARVDRLRDQDTDDRGVALARLAPGVGAEQAAREITRVGAEAPSRTTDDATAARLEVVSLREDALAGVRPLIVLLTVTILVGLLLAATNVAGLLAARTAARRRELALRAALGSSRWQLMAPVLAEATVISAAAAVAGSLLAMWLTEGLLRLWPPALPLPADVRIDGGVLAFGAGAAVVAALCATLLPAWRGGRPDALLALRSAGTVGADPRFLHLRNALIVLELALSVVLLSGTGLLVRTFSNLQAVEPGFRAEGAATFDLALVYSDRYRGPGDRGAYVRELEARLRALPGVASVGVIAGAPLSGQSFIQPWGLPGEAMEQWRGRAQYRVVSEEYFDAIGTRLLRGRVFQPSDDRQDRRVVVIDETLALRLAQGADVVGRSIALPVDGAAVEAEIVGVVEDVRFTDLRAPGAPTVYVPYRHEASRRLTVVLRTTRDPATLATAVRRVVRELDARLPVFDYRPLTDYVAQATALPRFALLLLATFAVLAAFIAGASVYALLAFTTTHRTNEFGIRMLLGANRGGIVRLVLTQSARLTAVALPLGLVAAVLTGQLLRGLLFGVSPVDPATALAVCLVLIMAVFAASIRPALQASRVEPAEALRR